MNTSETNNKNFHKVKFDDQSSFDHVLLNIFYDIRARAYLGIYGKSNNHVIAAVPGLTFDINMIYSAVKVQSHNLLSRNEKRAHLRFGENNIDYRYCT